MHPGFVDPSTRSSEVFTIQRLRYQICGLVSCFSFAQQSVKLTWLLVNSCLRVLQYIYIYFIGLFIYFRLIHDRELTLFDGTRLIRKDKYDEIKANNELSDEQMTERLEELMFKNHFNQNFIQCIICIFS